MSKTDATDPYEVQARDRGLPGHVSHQHVIHVKLVIADSPRRLMWTTLTLPCDYNVDNGIVNRKLRQSLRGLHLIGSDIERRCIREVQYYGGCHSKTRYTHGRRGKSEHRPKKADRQLDKRRYRRQTNEALRQTQTDGGEHVDTDVPRVYRPRTARWD